eukprot:IDg4420t1
MRLYPLPRTVTPTVEYSSEEAASIAYSSQSAPRDPMEQGYYQDPFDPVSFISQQGQDARGRARRAPFVRRSTAEFEQKASSFESVCFECFLPGHRRPQCPHLSRTTNDPAFKAWVLANFTALQPWQQAWLHSLGRAPESMKSPLPTATPQMARPPPSGVYTSSRSGNGRHTTHPDDTPTSKSEKLTRGPAHLQSQIGNNSAVPHRQNEGSKPPHRNRR